ncbi:MAG: TonB-dependent receptor [Chlorobi bacterium]|nr:TonB-dependent receptor [Chlorobiota bacterium]
MFIAGLLVCITPLLAFDTDDTTTTRNDYQAREIVVTASHSSVERSNSPMLVSSISSQFLRAIGLPSLGNAVCMIPSVRTEVNCQTCNYSQVRISGLAGSYTQILVNGRPIVPPLVSLYGLDQFPTVMLERIEVLRGAASVLYGSSAIAGVVNLVTRKHWEQSSVVALSVATIDGAALETTANASVLVGGNENASTSLALTAHQRVRDGFDANSDGFTELARLRNTALSLDANIGDSTGVFHASLAVISEERRGGNRLDEPPDRADQAEYRNHDIVFSTASYLLQTECLQYEIFGALTATRRVHYTGIEQADGWGRTRSVSGIAGAHVLHTFRECRLLNSLRLGIEFQHENTQDAVPAYGYLIDQCIGQGGIFLESSGSVSEEVSFVAGLRAAWHSALRGTTLIGRAALLWRPNAAWQVRLNWGEGFRAPQAFEVDMHIAFAGGGVSFVRITPNLQMERAQSWSLSVTHQFQQHDFFGELSLDGFATVLDNPFVLADDGVDLMGNRILLRTNGIRAHVIGVSSEIQMLWHDIELTATLTLQRSVYATPVLWSEYRPPERHFLRTPDIYGSAILRLPVGGRIEAVISGVLTGPMRVPYMGVRGDRLVSTPTVLDCSVALRWRVLDQNAGLGKLTAGLELRNIFDAYQRDFDRGPYRDSNYIWGPPQPRTVGLRLEWMLQ